ncbi:MAG: hypothetical protein KJ737_02545 [Proteobacteria bacterium]|nr:hypothetical protein [Pseudomonadota bacterium]
MSSAKEKKLLNQWTSSFRIFFDRLLAKYAVSEDSTLKDWQITIFFLIFLCASVLGVFTCLTSVFLTIKLGKYYIAAFYSVVYLTFVFVTFGRFIPFRTRAWIGTGSFYILGLINLLKFGPVGSGRIWLSHLQLLRA